MSNEFQIHKNFGDAHYEVMRQENDTFYLKTGIAPLAAHNGWRRGKVHFLLGSPHAGKTTLVRTFVMDIIAMNDKKPSVGMILSEETPLEFLNEFNKSGKLRDEAKSIYFLSEMESMKIKTEDQWFLKVKKMVEDNAIDILIYDNITTSKMYEGKNPGDQSRFFLRIKAMAEYLNIPILIVGHTGAEVTENFTGIVSGNHIRGSKMPHNASQFFYIIQGFFIGTQKVTTLRVTKHRGQDVNQTLYQAFFYSNVRMFGKFECLDFEKFKEIFKNRNKL